MRFHDREGFVGLSSDPIRTSFDLPERPKVIPEAPGKTTGNVIASCELQTVPVPASERRPALENVRPGPRQSPRGERHSGGERKRSRIGSPKEARAAGASLRQAAWGVQQRQSHSWRIAYR